MAPRLLALLALVAVAAPAEAQQLHSAFLTGD